jgi:hypothetical protein
VESGESAPTAWRTAQPGPGIGAGKGARSFMDTTLNYAIGVVLFAGAVAIGLAILVW